MKLQRTSNGQLAIVYPGLTLTLSGPMADKFKGLDPKDIRLSLYDSSASMYAFVNIDVSTSDYKNGLDAPTPSPEADIPNQEDAFNVTSDDIEVKEAV